jgi:hypothetical protein
VTLPRVLPGPGRDELAGAGQDPDEQERPPSLRSILRGLQDELDEGGAAIRDHRREHGCRDGSCPEAGRLGAAAADAEFRVQMTRFLNQD